MAESSSSAVSSEGCFLCCHYHEPNAVKDFPYFVKLKAKTVNKPICSPNCLEEYICGITSIPSPDEFEWFMNSTDLKHTKEAEKERFSSRNKAGPSSRNDIRPSFGNVFDPSFGNAVSASEYIKGIQFFNYIRRTEEPNSTKNSDKSLLERLPGELRNKIYGYVWDYNRVLITRKPGPKPRPYKLAHYQLPRRDPKTQKILSREEDEEEEILAAARPIPLGLILSCKTIHREVLLMLYSSTQFVFNTTRSVRRFLEKVSPDAKAAIRHVELCHDMYREPMLMTHRKYMLKSEYGWRVVCDCMAKDFKSLQVLHIDQTVDEDPNRLLVWDVWTRPYLAFTDSLGIGRLDWVEVKLHMAKPGTMSFDEQRRWRERWYKPLRTAACELERLLMKEKEYQDRQNAKKRQKVIKVLK